MNICSHISWNVAVFTNFTELIDVGISVHVSGFSSFVLKVQIESQLSRLYIFTTCYFCAQGTITHYLSQVTFQYSISLNWMLKRGVQHLLNVFQYQSIAQWWEGWYARGSGFNLDWDLGFQHSLLGTQLWKCCEIFKDWNMILVKLIKKFNILWIYPPLTPPPPLSTVFPETGDSCLHCLELACNGHICCANTFFQRAKLIGD